ncbi:MAG TPA: tetratricopeptide repeat protein [Candidatus Limnocylindrales bacterium]|nr:tetratricopeptide repeat protein [Candidatus Limnocylindrales bacterium]
MSRSTRVGAQRSILRMGVCLAVGALATGTLAAQATIGAAGQRIGEPLTFARDIAPILYQHCAVCHRPGALGPMSLLSYQEVRPWARAIREQVSARRMPPWKAEPEHGGPFIGDRRLPDELVALIERWVAEGAIEGRAADLPPAPVWPDGGWRLGTPDLIVEMAPYPLPAGGPDVLRKFAIPIPIDRTRYVKGVEFQPGNARVVHHANMRIDPTAASRTLDAADPASGYEGVTPFAARFPPGYFLGWTPGQLRPLAPDTMAWRVDAGSDMLLELHLMPGSRPEQVKGRIGLYFADTVPTRIPASIRLGRQNLDIPAGATAHVSRDSYVLPVDVEVLGVQPHAHYLARDIKGYATLPDGTRKWLIAIKDWDFDWQDFYEYEKPFVLPRGTELVMEITYDNSAGNRRNPNAPPTRVTWGQQSSNEMGDLWIQVLPRTAADLQTLNSDRSRRELEEDIVGSEMILAAHPELVIEHNEVALHYLQFGKVAEAVAHFRESARLQPESAAAQYNLGTTLMQGGEHAEAIRHFEQALRLNPGYVAAHNSLGAALRLQGRAGEASGHFRQALQLRPGDADALYNLASVLADQGDAEAAIAYYRRAIAQEPEAFDALVELAWLLAAHPNSTLRNPGEAVRLAERASRAPARQDIAVLDVLAVAYASADQFDRAVAAARRALAALPADARGSELEKAIQRRLDLYAQGRPYRGRR